MDSQTKRINYELLMGWTAIVAVLAVAYVGELIKDQRTIGYVLIFIAVAGIPAIVCWLLYYKNPYMVRLRYIIVAGYFCMYLFAMFTGSTFIVFTYIFPLLSLIILYHEPRLVLIAGGASLVVNAASIIYRISIGEVTLENSKDAEIQIALMLLCFAGCYFAVKLFDSIYKKNEDNIQALNKKNQQIQQMTMQTITTIANTIDAKDEYTKGHSKRVSTYSVCIARALGMSEDEIRNIEYIALLHDLGKIGVPDVVLNKPSKLTDSEYELMKSHTIIGGDILKDSGIFHEINVGAMYHHERYDGKGYPKGLKGDEIPLIARIIGIADAYDAMTSTRVYRKRLKNEEVINEIAKCRGKQFDPAITDVFLDLLRNNVIEQISPDEEESVVEDDISLFSHHILRKVVDEQNRLIAKERELDYLTAVYNRKVGERKIIKSLNEKYGCLMMVDIDNMREINKDNGILFGDHCLTTVAGIISNIVPNAIVARFGGDEFVCLYEGIRTVSQAEQLARDIIESVNSKEELQEQKNKVSVSIGMALSVLEGQEYNHLLSCVDKALYHTKKNKGKSFHLYQSMSRTEVKATCKMDIAHVMGFVRMIDNKEEETIEYPELSHIKPFVREMVERREHTLGFAMFLIISDDNIPISIEERDFFMEQLEKVIVTMSRQIESSMRYSSTQQLIAFVDIKRDEMELIAKQILGEFYRKYAKGNISLEYALAVYEN